MAGQTLRDLFVHALKDLYYAEKTIARALPKMAGKARDGELKAALAAHLEETEAHARRLEKVFAELRMEPASVKCEAIDGILREGDEILADFGDGPAGDAGIVFAAQAVEHYEINRYGSLIAWARALKLNPVADLLKQTLDEEYIADDRLTRRAETRENRQGIVGRAAAVRGA